MNAHADEIFFLPNDSERCHPLTGQQILQAARSAFDRAYLSACRQLSIAPGEHAEQTATITADGTWMTAHVTDGAGRKRRVAERVRYPWGVQHLH